MKTLIDLEDTVFDFKEFLTGVESKTPTTLTWNKKGELFEITDFGTVFMGLDKVIHPNALTEVFDASVGDGPVFKAPENWRWAHIARSFGIFKSVNQARKNGWEGEPNPGFNFRRGRINKIKGEILVIRITDDSSWITDFVDNKGSKI